MVDCATPMGSGVECGMCLSAGNLPVVGLPAVTTKVCLLRRLSTLSPLRGLFCV